MLKPDHIRKTGIGSEFGLSRPGGYTAALPLEMRSFPPGLTSYVSNGRAALGLVARFLRKVHNCEHPRILLPAYLCESMIQPFVEAQIEIDFYPLNSDLSVDYPTLAALIRSNEGKPHAVMLMNYFGFPHAADLAARLDQDFPEITMIDDCTHVLLGNLYCQQNPPATAINIYSARKWAPFPDLGLVVWPRSQSANTHLPVPDRGYDWRFMSTRLLAAILRGIFLKWPVLRIKTWAANTVRSAETLVDNRVMIKYASPISRLLWAYWDWRTVWQVRRQNYQYLLKNWPSNRIVPLFPYLPEDVCPLGFPIVAQNRDVLKQQLISQNIYPPIHWQRPERVSAETFANTAQLAEQELTLPIDQRYGLQHMDSILEVIAKVS